MRTFYFFEIKPELVVLLKDNPYELFKTLETIYYKNVDLETSYQFIRQLINPISIKNLDISLFKHYKENYFYTKYKNVHSLHDVFRKENTILKLYKTYLKMETNVVKPKFFEELQKNHNFFVCDFKEKDYFWLDSLSFTMIG